MAVNTLNHVDHPYVFLFALWPIAAYGVWQIINLVRQHRHECELLRSSIWPEISGKVVSAETICAHVEVTYEYYVEGRTYTGKHKLNLDPVMVDRTGRAAAYLNQEARQCINNFPPGASVIIRFNPQRPEQSVLIASPQEST